MLSISIIIPIYNVERYVQRCIESVVAQTDIEANVECIIVNDCTPDDSMAIVHRIVDAYDGPIRFHFIEHEKNQGLSVARNSGIKYATSDYVLFVDSDDYLLPCSLKVMVSHLLQHPRIDMVIGNTKDVKNNTLLIKFTDKPLLLTDADDFFQRMLHKQIYLYAWNKLVRRDLLIERELYFEPGILYEDMLWSYQVFQHLKSVLLLPQVSHVYEYNPASIVNTTYSSGTPNRVLTSFEIICNHLLNYPPDASAYRRNMTVDYLMYIFNILMGATDVLLNCDVSHSAKQGIFKVRQRLMCRTIKYGRLLLAVFFLLLFPPLNSVQRFRVFRHHLYYLMKVLNKVGHLTDILHRKDIR